jgi:hypothetical protein
MSIASFQQIEDNYVHNNYNIKVIFNVNLMTLQKGDLS